jgi:hypothetical protein
VHEKAARGQLRAAREKGGSEVKMTAICKILFASANVYIVTHIPMENLENFVPIK